MDFLLLSRLTKDFLNLDPEIIPEVQRYRAGWAGSILQRHEKAPRQNKRRLGKAKKLLDQRKKAGKILPTNTSTKPKLTPPIPLPSKKPRPQMLFSRGALEKNRKKNPEPIRELMLEIEDSTAPKPIPGDLRLIRSLCKGKGILKKSSNGLFYLDVDNSFITAMLPFLKTYSLMKPPYFSQLADLLGAHIPVIPSRESAFHFIEELPEEEKEFFFTIEGLYSCQNPSIWPEVEEVWYFKVQSSQLEALRKKYFLPEHPNGHPFHIVVAIKQATSQKPHHPIMRISAAIFAA